VAICGSFIDASLLYYLILTSLSFFFFLFSLRGPKGEKKKKKHLRKRKSMRNINLFCVPLEFIKD